MNPPTPRLIAVLLAGLLAIFALVVACASNACGATSTERLVTQRLGLTRFTLQRLRPTSEAGITTIPLDLDGRHVTLRLERSSFRSPDFRVLAQQPDGELREVPAPAPETYHGSVAELPGVTVGGTIHEGRLSAAIALEDGRMFFVQPVRDIAADVDPNEHVVYVDDAAAASGTCATTELSKVVVPPPGAQDLSTLAGPRVADLALDCDYELYALNGSSVDATVYDVENVMSSVNLVYNRDCGIQHRLVRVIVRSFEPDPYTTTDPDTLLTQFKSHWNAAQTGIARDVAHLMTGKNIKGGVIGIAMVGVVCNRSQAYGLSQTRFTTNMGRRTALTAHELGHEWNADHCDGVSPCNIMCSSINGCNGIGLPNFEPMGANAIKTFAASRTCLDSPTTAVEPVAATDAIRLAAPRPSPFTGRTSLSYYLAEAGSVRLSIYDIAGHRVASLAEGIEGAGWHTRTWNGIDQKGVRLGSGVFHALLRARGETRVQKLILVQ